METENISFQILDGLHDVEGGLQQAIGDLSNIDTRLNDVSGQLWELHADLSIIEKSLSAIDDDLVQLHAEDKLIQNEIIQIGTEITWREMIVSVSDYFLIIDSAYNMLLKLTRYALFGFFSLSWSFFYRFFVSEYFFLFQFYYF